MGLSWRLLGTNAHVSALPQHAAPTGRKGEVFMVDRGSPHGPTVLVLTALPEEQAAVRALLNNPTQFHDAGGARFDVAPLPAAGWRLVLGSVGRGNDAAAALTINAIDTFHPVAVLFVGIAGGLWPTIDLGD